MDEPAVGAETARALSAADTISQINENLALVVHAPAVSKCSSSRRVPTA